MSFIPSWPLMATFTLASFLLAVTPGPDMTLFMSRTMTGGPRYGLAALLGATTGLFCHAMLAAFGLSALIAASVPAFTFIKVVGSIYLLWLAAQAIRHGSALSIKREGGDIPSLRATYLTGIGINLTNPKVVLFYVTFLPQFVDPHSPQASHTILFLALFFLVLGTIVNAALVMVAGKFLKLLRDNPHAMRRFDYGFAALMSGFALKLLTAQAR